MIRENIAIAMDLIKMTKACKHFVMKALPKFKRILERLVSLELFQRMKKKIAQTCCR